MTGDTKSYEEKLIKDFKDGSRERFNELVDLYSQKLYRFAYGLLGNHHDAEEVVQDAFIRAYNALDSFRGDSSFETWMHRITMNLARNKFHWNRRRGEGVNISLSEPGGSEQDSIENSVEIELPDNSGAPDSLLEKVETQDNVIRGINSLPETLKEAMVLRHVKDMPYEEIASVLDCKIGTVKSRIARGRELLREYLLNMDSSSSSMTAAPME
ncbi:ECF RNA polymerase sigma-E factor [bioreactor metagenome]|uniref:ECF RNA polymerase sigma-E factor n=1 Tax=bioreactor metagenome TaxID=1076179 RepID=A0A645FNI5_9ZZZZ